MDLFVEAGWFSWVMLAFFVGGLIAVVRKPENAQKTAGLFAIAVCAAGLTGAGLGQRLVDKYLEKVEDTREKVVILSAGTREATANHVLAGMFGLALMGIGTAVSAVRKSESKD
jgi:hypothetical protein